MELELPYILKHFNIAHIENNSLYIGNRKAFPFEKTFVKCENVLEVVDALKKMVTQGGGPLEVGLRYLQLDLKRNCSLAKIKKDAKAISQARPTNTTLKKTFEKLFQDSNLETLNQNIEKTFDSFDIKYQKMGEYGNSLIKDGQTILTTCFAEHSLILSCVKARNEGKKIKVLCSETRPYLQGARLTAPSLEEMGIEVKVITDNLSASMMGSIDLYMTASDRAFSDKTIINKIGTLSNAIICNYFHKPYYAFSLSPDYCKPDFIIERRSGEELTILSTMKTTFPHLGMDYPAFDVIDGSLVTSLITPNEII
ncbi:MAG: translation initiation factor 2 [Sphaerochaetaceae bacterium]